MSGYVPNNRNVRAAAEPAPYNGNFDQQASRPLEGLAQLQPQCLVGIRFVWDNGEVLPANIPYLLTFDQNGCMQGGLDARGSFTQTLPYSHYVAQLLANIDVNSAIASARTEMQSALDEILAAERAEAEQLRKEQAGRSELSNHFHTAYAFGKGFFLGAFGMLKSAKEMHDLASPYNFTWNLLASAWKTKAGPGETWAASYLRNFAQEQHEDLVEALGYDPASFTREQLAAAYEIACFIYDDGPSQQILERFAVDYAKAQNVEEVAEFGGGGVFELVLIAVLAVFTGGVAAVARGATALRHAASLKRLGAALQRLSQALKNAKIKLKGRAQGTGTGAQTVEVPRPREIKEEKIHSTGARQLSVNEYLRREAWANERYDLIRKSDMDLSKISANTGIPTFQVKRVKDHIFYKAHVFRDGSSGRFDADADIADAWERLQNGTHTAEDIQLFKHEQFESKFEGIFKVDYGTAHDKSQMRYPSPLD